MANWLKKDPSRTTLLRRKFVADMTRRFKALSKAIEELVVKDDVFGLEKKKPFIIMQMAERQAWAFRTDAKKIQSYRDWLQQQVDAKILSPVDGISGKPWTAPYIESSYRKGMVRAYTDMNSIDLAQSSAFYAGGKAQFLKSAFGSPEALQKVELLYTRSFTELKGVTDAMGQQMSRVLATGLSRGEGPAKISRELRKVLTKMKKTRADTIARTEVIAAHAEGQLDSFERLGVTEVTLMAEWSTAGDDKVCELCAPLEGAVMTIAEARGLLPRHPNCRCAWLPANKGMIQKGQKRGRRKDQAIAKSIKAEGLKTTARARKVQRARGIAPRSAAEVRRRSVWAGKGRGSKWDSVGSVGRAATDPFGSRLGTKAAEINSFLKEGGFVRVKDIVDKTGYSPQQISGQLNKLMKKGLIRREGNRGYTVIRGAAPPMPTPVRIPKPSAAPKPAVTGVTKPVGTKFETAEEYRQSIITEYEKSQAYKTSAEYLELVKRRDELRRQMAPVRERWLAAKGEESHRLLKEYHAFWDKLIPINKQIEAIGKANKLTVKKMRKLLNEKKSFKGMMEVDPYGRGDVYKKTMDEVLSWIPADSISKTEQGRVSFMRLVQVKKSKVSFRGHVAEYADSLSEITMYGRKNLQNFAHEFGHHLSYKMNGFMSRQTQFFRDRTIGESRVNLFDDIYGKKDKFKKYWEYAGRMYQNGRAPEVASVGIEYIWKNPYQAATKDPEWFNMIISSLKKIDETKGLVV